MTSSRAAHDEGEPRASPSSASAKKRGGASRKGSRAKPTPLQLARSTALLAKGLTQEDVKRELDRRFEAGQNDKTYSRAAVGYVMRDEFRSPDIERAFCDLVKVPRAQLFPSPPKP